MRLRVRAPRDLAAGLVFVAFGLLALLLGREYDTGTALRMGPGYFPLLLGAALLVVGALAAGRSLAVHGPPIERPRMRPLAAVLGGLVAFPLLLEPLGLAGALVGLVVAARLARREYGFAETLALAAALAAFSYVVFVQALGLPFRFWPEAGG